MEMLFWEVRSNRPRIPVKVGESLRKRNMKGKPKPKASSLTRMREEEGLKKEEEG